MLCLKDSSIRRPDPQRISIYDIPQELFDSIIEQCVGYAPVTLALSSVSFVSKQFRRAAATILFNCIVITLTIGQRRQRGSILDFLLGNPHIRSCVRKIRFCVLAGPYARQRDEYPKLQQVLPLLEGLRDVEFANFDKAGWDLVGLVNSLENPPRIAINDFFLGDFSKAHRPEVVEALQSSPTIRSLNCRPIMQDGLSDGNVIPKLQHIWRTVSFCRHLQSLTLTFLPCSPHLRAPWISKSNSSKWDGNCRHILLPIRELHIDGWLNLPEGNTQDGLEFLKAVPWPSIKKMTLSGDLVGVTLPRFGDELVSLRSLCLRSGVRSDSKNALPAVSNFLATKPLVELELDGFSNDLSIEVIANAQLRKLRLHTWETAYLGGPSRLRPAKDIRKCAELAPNLEHFMLDVARVGKLWHPTAIPGVDVDVQVYQILDALSRFSRLKILHLFPRFHSGNGSHPGMWKQAMEDEAQAVRIFRHMKSIQPRLELLVISSDNIVATLNEIDPMSWTVCSFGDYILVRVWQANKDYEQRQIWQGQRRLRTETKRYPYPEVYLSGVGPRLRRRRQL